MAISDNLNSIRTHLEDDYTALEQLGVSVEDRNIENIKDMANQIYAKFPKTSYAEGSNITLSNTLKGKLDFEDGIVGIGDISQKTTQGYNLLDVANASTTLEKATFTKLQTGYTVVTTNEVDSSHYGRLMIETSFIDSSKTYSFTCDLTCSDSYNSGELMLGWVGASKFSRPTPTANTKTHVFGTFSGITTTMFSIASYKANATIKVENFQIYEGSTDKTYEPYTNGASPNPSYPQEIEVVRGKNIWHFTNNNFVSNSNTTSNIINENKLEVTSTNTTYANTKFLLSEKGNNIFIPDGQYTFSIGKVTNTNSSMTRQMITLSTYTNGVRAVIDNIIVGTPKTITITNAPNRRYILEFWGSYDTALINTATFEEIQIEKGSTATSYLPYNTIGVKARGLNSFDYSVIDNNHISMSNPNNATISFNDNGFTITPITQGDNYTISGMDITNATIRSDLRKYLIEVKPNTTYTFIMDLNFSTLGGLSAYYSLIDSNYKVTAFRTSTQNSKTIDSNNRRYFANITTSEDTKYLGFRYGNQGTAAVTYSNIMLVEGTYDADTLPTYEPYQTPQTYQLSLGEYEFAKIGNYVDTIEYDVDEDKVYKNKAINKSILNGTESWDGDALQSGLSYYSFYTRSLSTLAKAESYLYCNILMNNRNVFSQDVQGITCNWQSAIRLKILNSNITTSAELRTFLANNNLILYYILATATREEITGTLKDQIKALYYSHSFTGTTIIEIDGQLPLIIKVRALKGE